jgi:hypothetical protein
MVHTIHSLKKKNYTLPHIKCNLYENYFISYLAGLFGHVEYSRPMFLSPNQIFPCLIAPGYGFNTGKLSSGAQVLLL